jgi:hypothetical protein
MTDLRQRLPASVSAGPRLIIGAASDIIKCYVTAFCLLADLLLDPENGGSISFRNNGKLPLAYAELHP